MNGNNQPPPQAVADLPIFETVVAAIPATFGRFGLLLQAARGALIILGLTFILPLLWLNALTVLLVLIAPLFAYCHFAVNWYRIQLMGPAGLLQPALRWDRRHWRFVGYSLLLLLGSAIANLIVEVFLGFLLPVASAVLGGIVSLYFLARFSFIFPALAVEEDYNLAFAWRHTQGQGLRLTAALLMLSIPLYIALSFVVAQLFVAVIGVTPADMAALQAVMITEGSTEAIQAFFAAVTPQSILIVKIIVDALFLPVLAVLFTVVAIAFQVCTGWVPAGGQNLPSTVADDDDDEGPGGPGGPGGSDDRDGPGGSGGPWS